MQRRKFTSESLSSRPSGTDGSDFSYRMVVDSRYTKVAQGKSRLHALFLFQVVIQLIGVLYIFVLSSKEEDPNALAISSPAIGFLSLMIGELGRRRSRINFLKVYVVASSIAILLWTASVAKNNFSLKAIQDLSDWKSKKLELLEIGMVFLGLLVQIFTISTIKSLIRNMSPPKRAS
ncbi:uncharacterized protein LOC131146484 [Malania oleifera]|uniref:uncharacterized protein LOC131146484 n=1 Tax=Malania oleifera TaxID=397392 RepID=UPI0025AE8CA9|nr:uncharacterized protein LOC131146484 [Malania oleifera]